MKRYPIVIFGFAAFLHGSATWGQQLELNGARTGTTPITLLDAANGPADAFRAAIRQEVRSTASDALQDVVGQIFAVLRATLGLSTLSGDPTTDPLSVLESAALGLVKALFDG